MFIDLNHNTKLEDFIKLLDHFQSSTEFFRWFAGDDLVIDTLFERKHLNKFERVGNYYLDNLRVFSGGGEFYLDKTLKSFSEQLDKGPHQYYTLISEVLKYKKVSASSTLTWPQYTRVSHFYHLGEICGVCWEIYEVENILSLANSQKRKRELRR